MRAAEQIFQQKIDIEGAYLLNMATHTWNANQSWSGANEAAGYLSQIHPLSSAVQGGMVLSKTIAARVKELDNREWNFAMKQFDASVSLERARIEAEKVEQDSKAAVITATKEEEVASAEYEAAKLALAKAQEDLDSANQMKNEEDARIAAEKAEKEARLAAEKAIEEARLAAAKAEEARQAALLAEEKAKAAAAKAEEEARIAAAKAEEIAKLRAAAGIVDPAPAKPLDTTISEPAVPAVSEAPMRPAAAVRPGSEAAPTRPAAKPAV